MTAQPDPAPSECQTPGARFATHIGDHGVTIGVELPDTVVIGKRDAIRLESSIHDALETVFAPFFLGREAA